MVAGSLFQVYGWSAYLSAAAAILTFATGILFFTAGEPFGKINDIASALQMVFTMPLAVMFFQLASPGPWALGLLTALLGLGGLLTAALGQIQLVLGRIDFEGSLRYFPAGAAIGLWLVLVNALTGPGAQMPALLAGIGILAGAGYVLTVVGFLRGRQRHPLFYLGGLMLGIGYPVWAIWLGRLILSGALETA